MNQLSQISTVPTITVRCHYDMHRSVRMDGGNMINLSGGYLLILTTKVVGLFF